MDLTDLKAPFAPEDIEWRVAQAGEKDGKVWAKVLAYITSRAIMDRLDSVCGPENWATDFRDGQGHLQAGIGIRTECGWVWKWDGTGMLEATDGLGRTDAGKGDFSNALKRAAVQWGIGRYLYKLPEGWAIVNENGRHFAKTKDKKPFRWDPPRLPDWAMPSGGSDPLVGEMEMLWIEGQKLGIGADDDVDSAGMAAVEIAISTADLVKLRKAKPWLTKAIQAAKATPEVPA